MSTRRQPEHLARAARERREAKLKAQRLDVICMRMRRSADAFEHMAKRLREDAEEVERILRESGAWP